MYTLSISCMHGQCIQAASPCKSDPCKCQALTELDLSKTPVPDSGIRHLKPFRRLARLALDDQRLGDALTDEGLRKIGHIASLRSLSLRGNCTISAAGLACLSSLPSLRQLDVRGCLNISAHAALRSLQVPARSCWQHDSLMQCTVPQGMLHRGQINSLTALCPNQHQIAKSTPTSDCAYPRSGLSMVGGCFRHLTCIGVRACMQSCRHLMNG